MNHKINLDVAIIRTEEFRKMGISNVADIIYDGEVIAQVIFSPKSNKLNYYLGFEKREGKYDNVFLKLDTLIKSIVGEYKFKEPIFLLEVPYKKVFHRQMQFVCKSHPLDPIKGFERRKQNYPS